MKDAKYTPEPSLLCTLIGNYVAFFDKDLENVLFSLELETYNDYLHFIELMKERIEDE